MGFTSCFVKTKLAHLILFVVFIQKKKILLRMQRIPVFLPQSIHKARWGKRKFDVLLLVRCFYKTQGNRSELNSTMIRALNQNNTEQSSKIREGLLSCFAYW